MLHRLLFLHITITCIVTLSKHACVVPLKTKTGSALVEVFTTILRTGGKAGKLQTDAGTEFKHKTFQWFSKQHGVHHFVTYDESKAHVAEQFNRTLKQMM